MALLLQKETTFIVILLLYIHGNSYGQFWTVSYNLATLFLGRLTPPKHLISTKCTNFCKQLTTAFVESADRETKV